MIKNSGFQNLGRPLIYGIILKGIFVAAFAAISVFSTHDAMAQDVNNRLSRIENEIQTLSRAVFKGEAPPPGMPLPGEATASAATANTELRLQQIELDLRNVTGKVEEQNFQIRQNEERMEKMLMDMEQRVAELERQLSTANAMPVGTLTGNAPSQGSGGVAADFDTVGSYDEPANVNANIPVDVPAGTQNTLINTPDTTQGQLGTLRQSADDPVPEGADVLGTVSALDENATPIDYYERAFSYLRDRDYGQAEVSFIDFLKRYPGHELAPNAKYWLGETYYVRNEYEKAARIFAESYQKYPDGPKGPDNLLKLGMSLAGMGKKDDACVTFTQLKKVYGDEAPPILARAEKEMQTIGCS